MTDDDKDIFDIDAFTKLIKAAQDFNRFESVKRSNYKKAGLNWGEVLSVNRRSYVIPHIIIPWFFIALKSFAFGKILKIWLIDSTL